MLTLSGAGQPQNGGAGIEERFVISVKTDNAGTSLDNEFTLPWIGTYDVDWGDGTLDSGVTNTQTHTYASAGTYDVAVTATTGRIRFDNRGDKSKLLDIKNWGTCQWTLMDNSFAGCNSLTRLSCADVPDLELCSNTSGMFKDCSNFEGYSGMNSWNMSSVTNISGMFFQCTPFNQPLGDWDVSSLIYLSGQYNGTFRRTSFNQNIESWDVSNVTHMIEPFSGTPFNQPLNNWDVSSVLYFGPTGGNSDNFFGNAFNQPLDQWDVSSALCMRGLFMGATSFNQDISMWDMSNVTDIRLMFRSATSFNQPLNNWNLSSLTTVDGSFQGGVFSYATSFNQDLDNWDMSRVTNIYKMFMDATSFNGSINGWDTSNVTNMGDLFWRRYGGMSFNQPLDNWDVSSVTNMSRMFSGSSNFDQNIGDWDVSSMTNMSEMFCGYTSGGTVFNNGGSSSIENWDTSNVTNMSNMFSWGASEFNHSMANWNIEKVTNFENILIRNSSLSTTNYTATLIGWAAQSPQINQSINFGNANYTYEAISARQTLVDTYGWTISDGGQAVAPEFAIQVKTDNAGVSDDNQFTLPWVGTYDVDWGDGTFDTGVVDTQTHTYPSAGTYGVKVTAATGRILFNNGGDKSKVIDIKNWGNCEWTNLERAFMGCNSLTDVTATDTPDFSNLIDLGLLFYNATSLTSVDVSSWDVSNVEQFDNMFVNCDITSLAVYNWNVSNAINLYDFVGGCSLLTTLDVSNWNVGNCSNFKLMFRNCPLVNPDVSNWDISSMTGVRDMFNNVDSFDRSLANWGVIPFANNEWSQFMNSSDGLSTVNYDATLIAWAALTQTSNININFGGSQYTIDGAAEAARNTLINTYGWTITDGGGVGVLDTYSGASAAYSLRNLASASVGSAVVRVRRSSDNTEQDFTSAEITDGTLATFCSGTDGFVTTWYDQSGNSNNASTPVALQQYLIVDNGVIYMSDGKPAIVNLNSSNKFLGWNEFTAVTVISVSKQIGAYSKLQCLFSRNYGNNTANERAIRRDDQSPYQNWNVVGNTQDWFVPANGDWYSNNILKTSDYTNPDTELLFLTNAGSQTYSISRIGDGGSTGRSIKSAIQEVIIYPTDQSANRAGIEANINTEYDIYEGDYLLEDYPGASAAYSLRNLIDTTTSVVRVRRSNDNTEQNFTETEITDGTLTTFTGVNDGFVVTWYDQSGNSNNATQSVAIAQPKIVSNGVVLFSNNKPSLRFKEGSTKRYFNHPLTNELNSSFSILSVVKADGNGSQYEGLLATNTMMKLARVNNGNWGTYPNGVTGTNLYTSTINLITMISSDGGTGNFYTNNTSDGSFTNTDGQNRRSIGGNGNQEFNGFISEMIIYPTDQSGNRTGIEKNINTEYTIY